MMLMQSRWVDLFFVSPHLELPDTPGAARLSVGGGGSLTLDFQEPPCADSAVVTKYKGQAPCGFCEKTASDAFPIAKSFLKPPAP